MPRFTAVGPRRNITRAKRSKTPLASIPIRRRSSRPRLGSDHLERLNGLAACKVSISIRAITHVVRPGQAASRARERRHHVAGARPGIERPQGIEAAQMCTWNSRPVWAAEKPGKAADAFNKAAAILGIPMSSPRRRVPIEAVRLVRGDVRENRSTLSQGQAIRRSDCRPQEGARARPGSCGPRQLCARPGQLGSRGVQASVAISRRLSAHAAARHRAL